MITVYISSDSIYEHSSIELTLISELAFSVKISGRMIVLKSGKANLENTIQATHNNGVFVVKAELLGWFKERTVKDGQGAGPENKYGMRFYPFVSSYLSGTITIHKSKINSIIVDLPDDFRIIWYGARVVSPNDEIAELDHAYGPERSKYLFWWPSVQESNGDYKIQVPVRLGGSKMLKLAEFPVFYWLLALMGVAIAAAQNKPSILIAAIVGVWTFMLRQWGNSNLPQRTTILTHGYIFAGVTVLLWGIVWWKSQLLGYLLTLPIFFIAFSIYKCLRQFGYKGVLPRRIEEYWSRQIYRIDRRQSSVWERTKT